MAHLKSLLDPEQVLRADFEVMNLDETRDHLRELLLGEKDSIDQNAYLYPNLKVHETTFREKRIKVSKHYLKLGGKLNPIMLSNELPNTENWIGIKGLIEP